jgi:hypothetical protein
LCSVNVKQQEPATHFFHPSRRGTFFIVISCIAAVPFRRHIHVHRPLRRRIRSKKARATSLGLLVFATEFLDLIWPIFLLLGIEHVRIVPGIMAASTLDFIDYPISHSLVAVIGWSVLIGGVFFFICRYRRGGWVVALVVFSHWVLDAIVHRPDLPVYPGGHVRVGLGLWNSWTGSIIVELAFFAIGIFM